MFFSSLCGFASLGVFALNTSASLAQSAVVVAANGSRYEIRGDKYSARRFPPPLLPFGKLVEACNP
jgi:hypothetical protein